MCNTMRTYYNLGTPEVWGKPAWAVLVSLVLRALKHKVELITLGLLQNVMLLSSRSLLL